MYSIGSDKYSMQTYTHINEDFLDAIDSEELKMKDGNDVCKAEIMDPYFEFTLFIFNDVENPDLETDLYHARLRLSKLIDMTFADNMRSEMLTIAYDIAENTERKIGWMTSDYTEHKFIEDNIQEITQDCSNLCVIQYVKVVYATNDDALLYRRQSDIIKNEH